MSARSVFHEVFRQITGLMILLTATGLQASQTEDSHGSIDIKIETEYLPESLLILIDTQDITEYASFTETGLQVTPPQALEAGKHTLWLSFTTQDGYDIRKRIELETGQETFYDGSTNLGISLRGKLYDKNDLNEQNHEVDAHLGHQANWQRESWAGDLDTDIWLFDRGTDIDPLENNRLEIINYFASAKQTNESYGLLAEAGYIQLDESQNTVYRLARRGAHANYEGDKLSLDIFTVNSQQHLGSEGGLGIGNGSDDNIIGFSTGWSPVLSKDKSLKLRAIYSKGSEDGDSLGTLSNNTPSEGDVVAVVLESSFNNLGLNIEVEFDQSSFDADTNDSIGEKNDNAYALRVKGNADWINYRAAFEHIGANYAVIANPLLQKDREYITLSADFDRGEHGFAVSGQLEHDNLDNEATRARLNKTYLTAEYRYRKGRNFSTVLSLQNNQLKSEDEPSSADIRDSNTNSILGKLSFASGNWNNLFSLLLSDLDDKVDSNNNSEIISFTISPVLYTQQFYFTPGYTITETDFNSGQKTTQDIFNLHIRGKSFHDQLDYQLSGSYSDLSDNTNNDFKSTSLIASTSWSLGTFNMMAGKWQHSIGLELEFYDTDSNNFATQEDSLVWLRYSVDVGYKH